MELILSRLSFPFRYDHKAVEIFDAHGASISAAADAERA